MHYLLLPLSLSPLLMQHNFFSATLVFTVYKARVRSTRATEISASPTDNCIHCLIYAGNTGKVARI